MYFIDHIEPNKIAIADTKDGVIECLDMKTYSSLKQQGVEILSWNEAKSQITSSMNNTCNTRVYNKLCYLRDNLDICDYLASHCLYEVTNLISNTSVGYIDWSKGCKVYSYSENKGFIIVLAYSSNGKFVLLKLNELGNCSVQDLPFGLMIKQNPIAGGRYYNLIHKKLGIDYKLNDEHIYMLMYNDDNSIIYYLDVTTFVKSGSLDLIEVINSNRVILV